MGGSQITLDNRVVVEDIRGRSRVTDMVYRSPFRIFQLENSEQEAVQLMFSHYGGGMLQGDKVRLDVTCGDNSGLRIQSQANAHVFRNENDQDCVFELDARLGPGSTVLVRPEPVVLHKDACYRQKQRWHLQEGARLMLCDWIQSGRSDSGECFEFRRYHSELEIFLDGQRLLLERFRCIPGVDDPFSYAAFMGLNHMVNLYYIGEWDQVPGERGPYQQELRKIRPLADSSPVEPESLYLSRHPLFGMDGNQAGWMVRILARSREDIPSMVPDKD